MVDHWVTSPVKDVKKHCRRSRTPSFFLVFLPFDCLINSLSLPAYRAPSLRSRQLNKNHFLLLLLKTSHCVCVRGGRGGNGAVGVFTNSSLRQKQQWQLGCVNVCLSAAIFFFSNLSQLEFSPARSFKLRPSQPGNAWFRSDGLAGL